METNIKKRETVSTCELDGRTFEINAYDPMLGNYILVQCINFVLPFGIGKNLADAVGTENVSAPAAKMMSKEEFVNFQKDILVTINEVLPGGNKTPVLRANGTYGTTDVTSKMLIRLMVASLAFNFKDFFSDIPLTNDSTPLQNLMSAIM